VGAHQGHVDIYSGEVGVTADGDVGQGELPQAAAGNDLGEEVQGVAKQPQHAQLGLGPAHTRRGEMQLQNFSAQTERNKKKKATPREKISIGTPKSLAVNIYHKP